MRMHTCHTHAHTHTCTHTHAQAHTHMHMHIHTCTRTRTCTRTHAHMHTHTRTHMHTHTHTSAVGSMTAKMYRNRSVQTVHEGCHFATCWLRLYFVTTIYRICYRSYKWSSGVPCRGSWKLIWEGAKGSFVAMHDLIKCRSFHKMQQQSKNKSHFKRNTVRLQFDWQK